MNTMYSFFALVLAGTEVPVIPFQWYLFLITGAIGAQTANTTLGITTQRIASTWKNKALKNHLRGVRGEKGRKVLDTRSFTQLPRERFHGCLP